MSRLTEPLGFVNDVADGEDDQIPHGGGTLDLAILAVALGLDVVTLPVAAVARVGDNEVRE